MQRRYYHTLNAHGTTNTAEIADSAETDGQDETPKTLPAAVIVHVNEPYPSLTHRLRWGDRMKSEAGLSWSQYAVLQYHARAAETHGGSPATKRHLEENLQAGETTIRKATDALEAKLLLIPVKRGKRTIGYRLPITAIMDDYAAGGRRPNPGDPEIQNARTAKGRARNRPPTTKAAPPAPMLPPQEENEADIEHAKPSDTADWAVQRHNPDSEQGETPTAKNAESALHARADTRDGRNEGENKELVPEVNTSLPPSPKAAKKAEQPEAHPNPCDPIPDFEQTWAKISMGASYSTPWSPRLEQPITREILGAAPDRAPDHFAPLYVTFKIWEFWAFHEWRSIAAALNHYRQDYRKFLSNLTQWTGTARFIALAKIEELPEKLQIPEAAPRAGKTQRRNGATAAPRDPDRYSQEYRNRQRGGNEDENENTGIPDQGQPQRGGQPAGRT